jgi:drug/metabolite transporter (DMT)-like permease
MPNMNIKRQQAVAYPLAIAAMIGSAACWGSATVLTKSLLGSIAPFTLLSIQLASSVAVLWLAVLALRITIGPARQALRSATTGIFEPGLAYAVSVPGLALTTAANASVIAALEPVFIILLAWAVLGTVPKPAIILVTVLAIAGVCLVSLSDLAGLGSGDVRGDGLILLGTAFAAVYVLTSSRLVVGTAPLALTALQQSMGFAVALGLTVAAFAMGFEPLPSAIPSSVLLVAVASGLIQYALAFWLYLVGLRGLPVSTAGMFLTLTPLFGVAGGMLFLGETVTLVQLAGAALIIGSIAGILASTATDGN